MDLLFKRYAGPFPLMDAYIQTGRLCDFIAAFGEQTLEDNRWEYFLHKVWDKSYAEFCEELRLSQSLQNLTGGALETTVKKSMDILGTFNPEQEGGGDR